MQGFVLGMAACSLAILGGKRAWAATRTPEQRAAARRRYEERRSGDSEAKKRIGLAAFGAVHVTLAAYLIFLIVG